MHRMVLQNASENVLDPIEPFRDDPHLQRENPYRNPGHKDLERRQQEKGESEPERRQESDKRIK